VSRSAGGLTAGAAAALVLLAGCSSGSSATGAAGSSGGSATTPPAAAQGVPDAAAVVAAFGRAGLPTDGASDTTAADCGGDVGCSSALTLPAVVVRAFPTSGKAEIYANAAGVFHVVSVALTFAPDVTAAQQRTYEAAASRAVP
jgi:hypothetical protein